MMKYKAQLVDDTKTFERPIQTFADHVATINDWAKLTLAKHGGPNSVVKVYLVSEQLVDIVKYEEPKNKQ